MADDKKLKRSSTILEFQDNLKYLKNIIPEDELREINLLYSQLKKKGKAKARMIREPMPIEEWINSEYHVGQDANSIYPFWKKELIKIVKNPVKINQVIITGSIGIGKTTFAALLLLRRIYELSCYENIHALFNLMGVSRIAFAYLSVTKDQAEASGFSLLREWIGDIPYFTENFPKKHNLDSMVIFPQENLFITFGSVANHFIGMNLIGSVLDEANFFEGRPTDDANLKMNTKVSSLYSQIVTRSQSRFIVGGVNHSLSIVVSSSTIESSFTEQLIEAAKDDPTTYVISPSLWEVKPENYPSGKSFYVYVGGQGMDPFVLKDIRDLQHLLEVNKYPPITTTNDLQEAHKIVPNDIRSKLIKVPIEHRSAFQTNIITALQDLAGYSVSASSKFFNSYEIYNKAIENDLQHPFSHQSIVLSTTPNSYQEGHPPIKAYLNNGVTFNNPHAPRYIHLDLALTGDSVGIAMSHISGFRDIYNRDLRETDSYDFGSDSDDYSQFEEDNFISSQVKVPIIEVDFMLQINPPKKPNKISFSKIRDFIYYLKVEKGLNIELITADQFQSAQLLQEFQELGFNTANLSVDRDTKPYDTLANLYYENRINHYDYKIYQTELFNLVKYNIGRGKIDHPAEGSKDVSDAVAGAVYNAVVALDKTDMTDTSLFDLWVNANTNEARNAQEKLNNLAMEAMGLSGIKVLK